MLPSPTRLHRYGGVGVVGDRLYLFGGNTTPSISFDGEATVDVFDLTNELWLPDAQLPPRMPSGRYGLSVVSTLGRLYTIGGDNGVLPWNPSRSVDVFDPSTGGWAELRPLTQFRRFHNAVTAGNKIGVFGGDGASSTEWITLGTDPNFECDVFEPDDDGGHANPWTITDHFTDHVKPGSKVTEARMCNLLDVDNFSIFTGASGSVTVQLTAPCDGDLFLMELYDSVGALVATAPWTCSQSVLTYSGPIASQYTIVISGRILTPGHPYQLEII